MYRYLRIAVIFICLALIFSSIHAVKKQTAKNKQTPKTEEPKPAPKVPAEDILAEYKGGIITKQDLDDRITKLPPQSQARYKTVDGQTEILDMLTLEEIFFQKALQMNVKNDPAVLEKLDAAKKQLLVQEYYSRNVKNQVKLTEAEKQDFYQQNLKDFYIAPYISILYIQPKDEANAQKAIKELNKGVPFTEVSAKYNINTFANNVQGKIKNIRLNGNIPGVGYDPELEALISASPVDTLHYLGPQNTTTGWSIIQIIEKVEGRQRPYLECESEVDQRLRPKKESELLNSLAEQHKQIYNVVVDTTAINKINLREPEKNAELSTVMVVTGSDPSLNMSVKDILNKHAKMSPQEQIMYVKGGGPLQMVNQELNRTLMYLDAQQDKNMQEYLAANEDYKQAQRYYTLQETYTKLVLDSLNVSPEDLRTYYDEHISDYTTPTARKVQAVWCKDMKSAQKARKQLAKAAKANNRKAIEKVVKKYNTKPELETLDNLYNNGIVLGIGTDNLLSELIWSTPVGSVGEIGKSVKGDIIVFRVLEERPPVVRSFTEVEPRLQGQVRNIRAKERMEVVKSRLSAEFDLKKYPEKLVIKLTAEELFDLADGAARQRKFKDATIYYDQIIQFYPNGEDDYKATFMKAFLTAEEMGNKEQGLMLFKEFLKKYPGGELNESAQYMIDELEGRHPQLEELMPEED